MDLDLTPWVRLFNENVPRVAISIVTDRLAVLSPKALFK